MFPEAAELPVVRHLPDPFTFLGGRRVHSLADWPARRRELELLMQHYQYGPLPPPPDTVEAKLQDTRLSITVMASGRRASFEAHATLPGSTGPFPAFILAGGPLPALDPFVDRGYAVIALDTSEIASDQAPSSGAFYDLYPDSEAGVLMAWAWAMHRIVDATYRVRSFDPRRLAVSGFSRWGKAALVAGALDERIALTVPCSSGLSGVGQYRYFYENPADPRTRNEKLENIVNYAPQWYTPRFREFEHGAQRLPFDQHQLMALVAPRALFMTAGTADHWINPRGSALAMRAAQKVFNYLGAPLALGSSWDNVGHEITPKHLGDIVDFANLHFAGTTVTRDFQRLPEEFPDDPEAHPWQAP